jgi:hypothetical protein
VGLFDSIPDVFVLFIVFNEILEKTVVGLDEGVG